ncbi:MAG: tetratricopeptide repeat protein [Chloroflexota bacterium]
MARLKLYLLGPPQAELENEPVKIQRRKVLALLVYLAVNGEAQRRDTLATLLWPDSSQSQARAALTRHLSEIRKIIGEDSLMTDRETVALTGAIWFDVNRFRQLVDCPPSSAHCLDSLTEAATLYRDDFLTGFTLPDCPDYDEWQFFQTEGLRQQLATALERLINLHIDQAEYEVAIPYARRWLALDPLHEPAHKQLIHLYAWQGQWAAAMRQYETCLELLEEELGIPPTEETEQLYSAIKGKTLTPPKQQAKLIETIEDQKPSPISLEEASEADLPEPLVVARDAELAQLHNFLEEAMAGQGRVIFVTGEAGAGKTTLVTKFIRQAQKKSVELLSVVGNCHAQTGRGDPYQPFRDILNLFAGDVDDKLAQGTMSSENARRLQEFFNISGQVFVEFGPILINTLVNGVNLASRAAHFGAENSDWVSKLKRLMTTDAPEKPDLSQAHIFEQYSRVLQALATKKPVIVWLDDLHWVDSASADLLFHLGRQLIRSQILIIGTYRPEEVALGRGEEAHPLANIVNEFKRSWGDIQVDLDQARVSQGRHFVEALLDAEPNHFDEAFRQTMYTHTGGHPLFTVELLRDLQERSDLVLGGDGYWIAEPTLDWSQLPAKVEGILEKRIGQLDIDFQETLAVASVEGEQFTAEVVAQVQNLAGRELVRQLSGAGDKQHRLIQAQGSRYVGNQRLSRYQFRHNLIRNYLYNRLDEVERAYLHEAVGQTLEALYHDQKEGLAPHLEALAHHFFEAGHWPKALTYAQQAGEKALVLQAPQTAVERFTQALEAAEQLSHASSGILYRLRGQAFANLDRFDQARTDYETAQKIARIHDDQHLIWQTLLDLGQLWAARDYEKSGEYCQAALELAYSIEDQAAIGHSLNRLGNWLMNTGQPLNALSSHEEALEHFEALDDRAGLAATLDLLAATHFFCGNLAKAVIYYERTAYILRDLNRGQTFVSALTNLALATLKEETAREASNVAQEIEWRTGKAFTAHNLGLVLSTRGDYGQGRQVLENGLEMAQAINHPMWEAACNIDLGLIYMTLLAQDKAQHHLEKGLALAEGIGAQVMITYASGCLASLHIQQHRFDEAAKLLPDLPVEPLMGQDYWLVKPAIALSWNDQGAAQALQQFDQQPLLDQSNWLGWIAYFYGGILQLRSNLLIELERLDEAEAVLQQALDLYQAQGIRMDRWRVHIAFGELYQATGNIDAAETNFATARDIIRALAEAIIDDDLRKNFYQQAIDLIPQSTA